MSASRALALTSLLLGLLAIAAIPIAAIVAARREDVGLVQAELVAVAAAIVLGLLGVSIGRRARYRVERSVRRPGARLVRTARLVAWTGVYLGLTGALALGFYELLRASS